MGTARIYTVLVVDDEEPLRTLLRRVLTAAGIGADTAGDGALASRMLARRRYDALITDLRMPNKHGYQLITEVLEAHSPPPLIFVITALPEPRLAHDLFERGVTSIDYKPLHYEAFAAKVRGLLARRDLAGGAPFAPVAGAAQSARALRDEVARVTATFEEAIARLKQQQTTLEEGFLGSMRMLTGLVSQVGTPVGVHAGRVEAMAAHIGEQLGFDPNALRNLKAAALLHEIGQFGMPDSIRREPPWALSAEMRQQYELYPAIGATLLSEIPGTDEIVQLVESHAENFDGSGFPRGLRGEAIPLAARIIRVADAFDTYQMYLEPGQRRDEARRRLADDHLKRRLDPAIFRHALAYIDTTLVQQVGREAQPVFARALAPGMELAESVYDAEGRYLARQGAILTPQLAERLRNLIGEQTIRVYPLPPRADRSLM